MEPSNAGVGRSFPAEFRAKTITGEIVFLRRQPATPASHLIAMPLDPQRVQKPFRKLRKSLKNLGASASADEVHDVRTRSRRVEAALRALRLDQTQKGDRLIRAIAPIRKRAGKVRDMDVFISFASSLEPGAEEPCRVQLLEHLGAQRSKLARKLGDAVVRKRGKIRKVLKRSAGLIRDAFDSRSADRQSVSEFSASAMAVALQHSGELSSWPRLSAGNLHDFRLKVKELQYVLNLSNEADGTFLDALGKVKDTIGEWHDWSELAAIAKVVLDHGNSCAVRRQIAARVQKKFSNALAEATELRQRYLSDSGHRHGNRKKPPTGLKQPVLITTAKMAG